MGVLPETAKDLISSSISEHLTAAELWEHFLFAHYLVAHTYCYKQSLILPLYMSWIGPTGLQVLQGTDPLTYLVQYHTLQSSQSMHSYQLT